MESKQNTVLLEHAKIKCLRLRVAIPERLCVLFYEIIFQMAYNESPVNSSIEYTIR